MPTPVHKGYGRILFNQRKEHNDESNSDSAPKLEPTMLLREPRADYAESTNLHIRTDRGGCEPWYGTHEESGNNGNPDTRQINRSTLLR
jgi:hypothetical protein